MVMKYWKIALGGCLGLTLAYGVKGCPVDVKTKLVESYEYESTSIKELNLKYYSEDISIMESESDKIVIQEYKSSTSKKSNSKVEESDGCINITAYKPPAIGIYSAQVKVYLPKGYQGNIEIKTESGDITSEISLTSPQLLLGTGDGSVELKEVIGEEIHIDSDSGDIKLEKVNGEFYGETKDGKIEVLNFSGSADVVTETGKILMKCQEDLEELRIASGKGKIQVYLPRDLAFYFYGATEKGKVRTFFEDKLEKKGEGNYQAAVGENIHTLLDVSTASGTIEIKTEDN